MQNIPNILHIVAPLGWYGADIVSSPYYTNYKTIHAPNYYPSSIADYDWSLLTNAVNLTIGVDPSGVIEGSFPWPARIAELRVIGSFSSGSWKSAVVDWSPYSNLEFVEFSWSVGKSASLILPTSMKTLSLHTLNGESITISNSSGLETVAVFGAGGSFSAGLSKVVSLGNVNPTKLTTLIRDDFVAFQLSNTAVLAGLQSVTLSGMRQDDVTAQLPSLTNLKSLTLHNWDSTNASELLCSLASAPAASTLQSLLIFSLSGTSLPTSCLGSFANLRTLVIEMGAYAFIDMQAEQPFPTSLYSLTKIETIYVRTPAQIPYSGELRSDLWSSVWKNAHSVTLCLGQLSGTIPWQGITNLKTLNLTANQFTSWPPLEYGISTPIPSLQVVDLSGNQLTVIPDDASLQRFTGLTWFDISANYFLAGPIPSLFGASSKLTYFSASSTRLSGFIPTIYAPSLTYFAVDDTYLCGALPAISRAASQVPSASIFHFQSNDFNGTFPSSWASEAISELNIATNGLTGQIPAFLFAYSPIYTQAVYLDDNDFTSTALKLSTYPAGSTISLTGISTANFCVADPGPNPDIPIVCNMDLDQLCACYDYWTPCYQGDYSSCIPEPVPVNAPWMVRRRGVVGNMAAAVASITHAVSSVKEMLLGSSSGTNQKSDASASSRSTFASSRSSSSSSKRVVRPMCSIPTARAGRAAPPTGTSCPGTRPSSAFYCDGTSWKSYSDVASNTALTVTSGSTVVVTGSLTVGSISFGSTTSSVSVSGCVYNLSSVTVTADKETVTQVLSQPDGKYSVTFVTQSCSGSGGVDLTLVPIALKNGATGCKKVSVTNAKTSANTLVGLFTVDSSDCNIWWIVVITIGAVVIVVVAAIVLMVLFVPSVKAFVLPYQGTNA